VLHEFRQTQDDIDNIRRHDVVGQRRLEVLGQIFLVALVQFGPARDKGDVEQLLCERLMDFGQTPRSSNSLTRRLSHEIVAELLDPFDPLAFGGDERAVPRRLELLLIDGQARLLCRH
jgi:hypothetical protein